MYFLVGATALAALAAEGLQIAPDPAGGCGRVGGRREKRESIRLATHCAMKLANFCAFWTFHFVLKNVCLLTIESISFRQKRKRNLTKYT